MNCRKTLGRHGYKLVVYERKKYSKVEVVNEYTSQAQIAIRQTVSTDILCGIIGRSVSSEITKVG